ncbi:hypothetical protein GCM10010094_81220 [Streptomyces flaveus]|uniref:Uncharacterized protein n=1 Tax=Streptomyces flaveus TaxID=66370 RepID=A0A917RHI7_9ACTN|nr:hypothetical protein GCM10010094_81220 [Streptomyces flaveus]
MTADEVPPKAAQEYTDAMARDRGYVLDCHKVMARLTPGPVPHGTTQPCCDQDR